MFVYIKKLRTYHEIFVGFVEVDFVLEVFPPFCSDLGIVVKDYFTFVLDIVILGSGAGDQDPLISVEVGPQLLVVDCWDFSHRWLLGWVGVAWFSCLF